MRIRLYLDEDSMRQALVIALRARGIDVETALEADLIERPDVEHLTYARREGRVLFSFNVGDFYELHTDFLRRSEAHAGLVLAQQQAYSVGEQLRRLLKLIGTLSAEDMRNRVEFLSSW